MKLKTFLLPVSDQTSHVCCSIDHHRLLKMLKANDVLAKTAEQQHSAEKVGLTYAQCLAFI